jgi:hypothetical protein
MPSNAVRYPNWWMRGAYEDVFRLDFGDWSFPLGTASVSSLWVYTWGKACSRLRGGYEVCVVGSPMSAVPQVSEFWHASGTNGSKILTWYNFFLGRIPATSNIPTFEHSNIPTLISAQLELFPNGDFIARSNLVERSYKRVNPDDWDDDGIPNDIDEDPLTYGGDNFGPLEELPDGADSNNYCWVEVVVSNANSLVTFTGDGVSDLPDPNFIARAGETNRVNLLIGKTYRVASAQPIFCTAKSSEDIEVSGESPRAMTVVWPVSYEIVSLARSASRQVRMIPPQLSGTIQWNTNTCPCHAGIDAGSFSLPTCNGACSCYICNTGGFTFNYEGYSLSFEGVECDCRSDIPEEEDEGPYAASASVSFSKKAVIFEGAYMNTPTESVPKKSTRTTLSCVAHGGPNGGRTVFSLANGEKLARISGVDLPIEVDVPAGHKVAFEIVYEGSEASGSEDDIVATAQFIDNEEGELAAATDEMTVVEVELNPVNTIGDLYNRHKWGVCEKILLEWSPSLGGMRFSLSGDGTVDDGSSDAFFSYFTCPSIAMTDVLTVYCRGVCFVPETQVVMPSMVIARNPVEIKYDVGYGFPGGAGMQMDLYVIPEDVSFQWLSFMEVPSTNSVIDGYFSNNVFSAMWYHTEERGAGEWHGIQPENFFFSDTAAMGDKLLVPWSSGRIYWSIPVRGKRKSDDYIVVDDMIEYQQKFEISSSGCLRVSKFGFWVERSPNGEMNRSTGVKRWDE